MRGILGSIIAFCVAGYFVYDGGRGIYEYANFSKLEDKTLTQLISERPDMGYIRLTGGHFDYTRMVVQESKGIVNRLYIPYVAENSAVAVIASTSDEEILRAYKDQEPMPPVNVLQGMIDRSTESATEKFRGHVTLDEPLIVVIHNAEPSAFLVWGEFFFGLAVIGLFGFLAWSNWPGRDKGPEVDMQSIHDSIMKGSSRPDDK